MNDTLTALRGVDTPTICNAIEVAQGRRGFAGYTKSTVLCPARRDTPLVGYARTAKIAGRKAPNETRQVTREKRIAYFRYMADGPRPAVAVIEDTDYPDCVAAWWGEVHTTVHKGLGMAGALTNGVMRDLDVLEPGFPVIAGSVGPSHGFCHVVEFSRPVEVFGLTIAEGDLVHADRHGAVVIPETVIPDLERAVETLVETERIILGPAREPGFDIQQLESAWAEFERART